MSIGMYAVLDDSGSTIANVIVLDPNDCDDYPTNGLINISQGTIHHKNSVGSIASAPIDSSQPYNGQPGIGWSYDGSSFTAPEVVDDESTSD